LIPRLRDYAKQYNQEVRTVFNKKFSMLFVVITIVAFACYTAEAQVIQEGLVHYWGFDKIEGDKVPDLVGDNDVKIIRGKSPGMLGGGPSDPQIVEGVIGNVLEFDGDGDYAESTKPLAITGSDPRTLSAWVKFNSFGLKQVPVGWGWEGETNQACVGELFCICAWDGNAVSMWGVCNDHVSPKLMDKDTWYYITMVYDKQTDLEIYVDGESVYHNESITPLQTGEETKLTLGKKIFTFADRAWTNGAVDEVAIYDRPLNGDEVKHNLESPGMAVNPTGKLSLTWGEIKVSR